MCVSAAHMFDAKRESLCIRYAMSLEAYADSGRTPKQLNNPPLRFEFPILLRQPMWVELMKAAGLAEHR